MTSSDERQQNSLGKYEPLYDAALDRLAGQHAVERIWNKDASFWKKDDAHAKIIANALGWLDVVPTVRARVNELQAFADEVRPLFDHVVVLGMGGSSLCSEVMRRSFGKQEGFPELLVLDSTVPAAVLAIEHAVNLERTLFIVASKSGTTTEPVMFHRYFYDRVKSVKSDRAGENFIAVTDPGTQLHHDAASDGFRKTFLNPADIGGRYSALSLFGMVPAALAGIDILTFLDRALTSVDTCRSANPAINHGLRLGAIIGALAREGRDKVTILASKPIDSVGLWIEQLVAESTGKEGVGILPVALEPHLDVDAYGPDRVFVALRTRYADRDPLIDPLIRAGFPVVEHVLEDALDLGAEFFIWEFATAVAGSFLGIDPFDQPNVQESKDNTKKILGEYIANGALPEQEMLVDEDAMRVYAVNGSGRVATVYEAIAAHLASVKAGDYVAFTEYIPESPEHDADLAEMRSAVAKSMHVATTTGYGPRFLHSTGQLHKGGADNGVFIQITADDPEDVPIPDEPFGFSILKQAQALGDFQSLASRGRRAIRVHLKVDVGKGLTNLRTMVEKAALGKRR